MPRKPESRGTCAYCGETIAKRSVTRHRDKCPKRQEALQSATASSRRWRRSDICAFRMLTAKIFGSTWK
jgi:hypothetical protein